MMKDSEFPSGVIVSNEVDVARCDRLAANLIRLDLNKSFKLIGSISSV